MANWVLGTDTSHWSGDIDFNRMYSADAKWWVTKSTDAYRTSGQHRRHDETTYK